MNILYFTPFPIIKSSSGVYVQNLAEYFTSHGHNVLIVNIDNEEQIYDEKPYHIITINFKRHANFNFPCFTTHPHTDTTFYALNANQIETYKKVLIENMKNIIDEFNPDIIHSQYLWINSCILGKISNTPLVVTSFGSELHAYNEDQRYKDDVLECVDKARFIIAPSKQIELDLRKEFSTLDSVKLKLIYKGFDDNLYQFIDEEKKEIYKKYFGIDEKFKYIIFFNDNLTHIKGIDIFLQTAKKLAKEREDICFVIVGQGDYKNEVQKTVEEYHGKIFYFPEITNEEKPLLFYISDITVIPSRFEKFGINALESFAMGTPVIANKVGEFQNFVNNENGRLIENLNEQLLIENINELINIDFKKSCSFFCYQFAQRNYSMSSAHKLINKLYDYALSEQ